MRNIPMVTRLCSIAFLIALTPSVYSAEALDPKDKLIVETVLRLKDFDLQSSQKAKDAIVRFLRAQPGTDQYFAILERFSIPEFADDLTSYALENSNQTGGLRAASILFSKDLESKLLGAIESNDPAIAVKAIVLVGMAAKEKSLPILLPIISSEKTPTMVRAAAITAIGKRITGQKHVLDLITKGRLPEDLKFSAANLLLSSEDDSLRSEASKHLTLPATADSHPLPPIDELVKRKGNAERGGIVFRKTGTCINCHKVRGEGKEVGPDLSEIGSKLSRDAMYVSILDPSAAVSHNFETYSVLTYDGTAITGLLISDTEQAVTLRNAEGIDQTIKKDDVEIFQKQPKSLMPQDLQRLMTVEQLVDLVEYAMTLVKAK